MKYRNPLLPGFHPDPSICRVGEDYYLVNSSFEFFPGVPLWHSRDLVNWEQLGHVLDRKSQLNLENARVSGGIFAPTIRYHQGKYYMITTNVTNGGNFVVWTEDPKGPWSDPVWIDRGGIDPSLFWDEDGKVYMQRTHMDENDVSCIGQFQVDLETGEALSEVRPIWYGTGGKCPEGPHIYKIGEKYYLMIAEGGTEYGHMETIARSDSIWGPFESCPHNPILTHRDINPKPREFQGLGHADLVEDGNGNWWMVFHGIRPSQFMLHHMGRETMLAPVTWDEEGWPVVGEGKPILAEMEGPGEPEETLPDGFARQNLFVQEEDFTKEEKLPPVWAYLRNFHEGNYKLENGLLLTAGEDCLESLGSPSFVGRRQQHFNVNVETVVDFAPQSGKEEAGLTVFHTKDHHYDLVITRRDGKRVAFLRRRCADMLAESQPVSLPEEGSLTLTIQADALKFQLFVQAQGTGQQSLGTASTQLISTECMICTFTGCFFGLYCQGEKGAQARFKSFRYLPQPDEKV